MQIDPQIHHGVRLTVDDVEAARDFAVRLAAGGLAGLEREQEPLPQRKLRTLLERGEHRVRDARTGHHVGRDDHVPLDAMAGPRLVVASGARRGEARHVQAPELPALDELVARRDLLQHARRRVPGAQQIQAEMAEPRVGAGLGHDGAHPRGHVNAAGANRHLAGGDGDAEHAGALAPADERERRELDADQRPGLRMAITSPGMIPPRPAARWYPADTSARRMACSRVENSCRSAPPGSRAPPCRSPLPRRRRSVAARSRYARGTLRTSTTSWPTPTRPTW